jgi:membrane protease YdiL (CAAX protease family)
LLTPLALTANLSDLTTFLKATPSLLRILLFFLLWVLVWLPLAIPLAIALKWRPPQPLSMSQKLPLLASLYLLAPLLLWGAATLTDSSFARYGLSWDLSVLRSLGLGLILGVLGIAVLFGAEFLLGWVRWQSPTPETGGWKGVFITVSTTLLLGLWVSLTEELIFRGFLLNELLRDFAPWIAAAIASLIFAVLHLVWEGRENLPQLPGLWLMGMVLVLARWVDGGDLGLAWGLHAGWVWAIATLDTTLLLPYTERGATWLRGIDNKPLAGLMGILFLLGTAAMLWGIS